MPSRSTMLVVRCLSFRVSILLWLQFLSLLHTIVDGIHRVLRLFNHILLPNRHGDGSFVLLLSRNSFNNCFADSGQSG